MTNSGKTQNIHTLPAEVERLRTENAHQKVLISELVSTLRAVKSVLDQWDDLPNLTKKMCVGLRIYLSNFED